MNSCDKRLFVSTKDEVLNDLIVLSSNERTKIKYLQKCGAKKREKNVELQDEMSYNTLKYLAAKNLKKITSRLVIHRHYYFFKNEFIQHAEKVNL